MIELQSLKDSLDLSVRTKPANPRSASIAYSTSGKNYRAGHVESNNHILSFPSETVALTMAVAERDYGVDKITSIVEDSKPGELASPITLKLLVDHARRTDQTIAYTVVTKDGDTLYHVDDVQKALPFYQPERVTLKKILATKNPESNFASVNKNTDLVQICRQFSTLGLDRSFTVKDGASDYGACVVTEEGKVYFTGQYSSFEHQTNIHAEMAAVITTLMRDKSPITHLGLASSKHRTVACEVCGICRQFLQEISDMLKFDLRILTFALETNEYHEYTLKDYLPSHWSNVDPQSSKIPTR